MRCFLYLVFCIFTAIPASGMNIYNRRLNKSESRYLDVVKCCSATDVTSKFKACSRNAIQRTGIDCNLEHLIEKVASNSAGKDILTFVIVKIEPVVKCLNSLMKISKALTTPNKESVACALNFLNEIIPFSDAQDLSKNLGTVKVECDNLLKNPREFTCNKSESIFNKFTTQQSASIQHFFSQNMSFLKGIIDSIVCLLLEKTFELAVGENTFYHLNNRISVSIDGVITSNVVTGPKAFHLQLGTAKIVDSVVCQRQKIEGDVCFIHELSHYIRKVFDGIVAGDFLKLLPMLDFLPDKYITTALEKTFSNDEEFRNITGIFFHGGALFFDPLTEAGYVIANQKGLRNSHNIGFIPRMPIGLILKIEELSGQKTTLIGGEIEFSESLNSW